MLFIWLRTDTVNCIHPQMQITHTDYVSAQQPDWLHILLLQATCGLALWMDVKQPASRHSYSSQACLTPYTLLHLTLRGALHGCETQALHSQSHCSCCSRRTMWWLGRPLLLCWPICVRWSFRRAPTDSLCGCWKQRCLTRACIAQEQFARSVLEDFTNHAFTCSHALTVIRV